MILEQEEKEQEFLYLVHFSLPGIWCEDRILIIKNTFMSFNLGCTFPFLTGAKWQSITHWINHFAIVCQSMCMVHVNDF